MIPEIIEKFCNNLLFDEALIYAELLYSQNNSVDNLEVLAKVLYNMQRYECAFELIQKELKHKKLTDKTLTIYGFCSIYISPEKGLKAIKSYLIKNEGSEYLHIIYARLNRLNGDVTNSKRHFEKAIELNPLLLNAYREAMKLGSTMDHSFPIKMNQSSDEPLEEEHGDPGIVTRAHQSNLESNLMITKNNLKISTSLKRKSSDISSFKQNHPKKKPKSSPPQFEINEEAQDHIKCEMAVFKCICQRDFQAALKILREFDSLNKFNSFISILRIICQHELNLPKSETLFSISVHVEKYELHLEGLEYLLAILWMYQDSERLSKLKSQLKKRFPNSFQYYLCKGCSNSLEGETEEAIKALTMATNLDESGFAASLSGWVLLPDEKFDLAMQLFNIAKKRNSTDARALTGLGCVYLRTNNVHNALIALQDSERLKNNSETNKLLLSEALRKSGKLVEAYEVINGALSLFPKERTLINEKIVLCLKMNQYTVFLF
eukprot:NODE_116_length_18347_cov_2.280962.p3 type:complete len:492 gc:universal NODE_116_length_18347_cov_2.280962:9748-11223(+)